MVAALTCACLLVGAAGARATQVYGPDGFARTGDVPRAVAFTADGKFVATADQLSHTISVFSTTPSGKMQKVPGSPFRTGSNPLSLAFSPNGKLLAVANALDNALTVYSVGADGALKRAADSPVILGSSPWSVAFSPDGRFLASGNQGSLSVFAVDANGRLGAVPGSPFATPAPHPAIAFSPDGQLLALTDDGADRLFIYQVGSRGDMHRMPGTPLPLGDGAHEPTSVTFSPDGSLLAIATISPISVSMFYVLTDHTVPLRVPGSPFLNGAGASDKEFDAASSVSFSADGRTLAATTVDSTVLPPIDVISLFSVTPRGVLTNTGIGLAPLDLSFFSDAVATFSPDGKLLGAVSPHDGFLSLFDMRTPVAGAPHGGRNKRFSLSGVRTRTDGQVTFQIRAPGPGVANVLETAWKNNLARAASLMQPAPRRFVFARTQFGVPKAGTITVTVRPNQLGRRLVAHHRYPVRIRLWVTYKPRGGAQQKIGLHGVYITYPKAARSGKS